MLHGLRGLDKYRCDLSRSADLWQFDLLKPQELVSFAKDHEINIFAGRTVEDLWQVGLLRADVITSSAVIEKPVMMAVSPLAAKPKETAKEREARERRREALQRAGKLDDEAQAQMQAAQPQPA